jgi:nitrite reductase/ring-hydroxylating ferredoxin subunit
MTGTPIDDDWHDVGSTDDLVDENVVQRRVGETLIAVYNVAGRFYATEDRCTHALARLSDGYVQDDVVECPLHQGSFHIPTGRALRAPARTNVPTFPVRVVGDRLQVQVKRRDP